MALAALVTLGACGDPRSAFLGMRVRDACDGQWPVCDRIAGCLLGSQSYVEGRFPNQLRLMVQLFEPSVVEVGLFLEEAGAAGEETSLSFFEDRCRARVREAVPGRALLAENEELGGVLRKAELSGLGDHLIEVNSDAQAKFWLRVDVTPKRLVVEGP